MSNPQLKFVNEHLKGLNSAGAEDLTLFALNINRLRYKLNLLETYMILSLTPNSKPMDVIFLSETFLEPEETQFFNLDGYEAYHYARSTRKGGGIVFYVKNGIKVSHEVKRINKREVQMLFLYLPELNVKLCGIYRPPTSIFSDRDEFLELLDCSLEENCRMICVGDINIDLLKHDSIDLVTVLKSNNFQVINKIDENHYTREGKSSKTILDHCYTDIETEFFLSLEETGFSDHKSMVLVVKRVNKKLATQTVEKTFTDYKEVMRKLKSRSFQGFTDFHGYLTLTLQQETNVLTKELKSHYKKPWGSVKLKDLCQLKRKYSKLLFRFPDNDFYRQKIRELTVLIRREIFSCKQTYFSSLYTNNIGNAKEIWKTSKKLMYNRDSKSRDAEIELLIDGALTKDPAVVANAANNFFIKVGEHNNPEALVSDIEFEPKPVSSETMESFDATNPTEIKEIIASLDNNKACGVDGVNVAFIKSNAEYFSEILCNFINESFENGEFPDELKFARVKILFKGGDSNDINNYRPISILSAISKIFEKVIKKRLIKHLQTNKLIHPSQFGFLEASSTTSAASGLINDIVSGLNDKLKTSCIFVDVKKAFDCLNFEKLLFKLHEIGIEGKAMEVFKSYLERRKQVVVVNGVSSAVLTLTSGAAQGSVLGPLLFLIYINDLLYLKLNSVGRLFADDAAFIYRATNYNNLHQMMQKDLLVIDAFLSSINLEMSVKKTEFMIFQTKSHASSEIFQSISFGNKAISKVDNFRYLGLVIDSEITWREHVNSIALKIAPFVGLIHRIRPFISKQVAMQLYYSYIHSRLIYCLPIWSSCSTDLKMRLQRLQNKCIKAINFKPRLTPSRELYDDKLLSFLQLCEYESILLVHKIKLGLIKCDIPLVTNYSITNRTTRQSELLRLPSFMMSKSQLSLFYRGVSLYNSCCCESELSVMMSLSGAKTVIKRFVYNKNRFSF
jgi:exonuclease III